MNWKYKAINTFSLWNEGIIMLRTVLAVLDKE